MTLKQRIYYYLATNLRKRRYQRFFEKRLAFCEWGGYAYSDKIRDLYKKEHGLEIGYGTYGGCWENQYLFWKDIKIGNYCSFGKEIFVAVSNHNVRYFTTHPISACAEYGCTHWPRYVAGDQSRDTGKAKPYLNVGHDVWVGHGVIITPGCNEIGNGAVIGAGSVVTKDVPPYAIVAGNPAKILRYRFTEKQIAAIEATRWWEKDYMEVDDRFDEWNKLLLRNT